MQSIRVRSESPITVDWNTCGRGFVRELGAPSRRATRRTRILHISDRIRINQYRNHGIIPTYLTIEGVRFIMKRRTFLAASGTVTTVLFTGCAHSQQADYSFRVYNSSPEQHSFSIRIGNDVSESHFYKETLKIDSGMAHEEISLDQTPSRIFLDIDSTGEQEFPWPASTSDLGNIAHKTEIWYAPTPNQDIFIYEE
jgi:hypothetical protein